MRIIALVMVCALTASAQAARFVQERLVRHYDFDERAYNPGQLPKDWFVIGRPAETSDPVFRRQPVHDGLIHRIGYPKYNPVYLDRRHKSGGEESLFVGINSGHAGVFLQVGAVTAVPDSDYLLTVRVRTEDLQHARGRFTACFIDAQGRQIDASTAHSEKVNTQGQWQTLSVRLSGEFADAAYIGVQLQVLQPVKDVSNPLGDHQLVFQDVHGGAWFDDVMIWQLPSVSLTTATAVNVHRDEQPPVIHCEVRDLTGRPLIADVRAYNVDGNVVAHERRPVGAGEPSQWAWPVSAGRYGWYLIDLKVYEAQEAQDFDASSPVGRKISAVQWLAPETLMDTEDAGRFRVVAEGIERDHLKLMPLMLEQTGLRGIVLSAWEPQSTQSTLHDRQKQLDAVVIPMLKQGSEVTLSFSPLPEQIAAKLDIDANSPLSMFALPAKQWEQLIAPMLMNQGQRISRWQLGTPAMPDAFFMRDAPRVVAQVRSDFENLAPNPKLILPWRADQARRPELESVSEYLIDVPHAVRAEHMADHLSEWVSAPFSLHLRTPHGDRVGQAQRVRDLVLRMLHGWEAGATGLSLDAPWTEADERDLGLLPDPLLGAFACVSQRLAGRRVVGRLHIGEGVYCMIFSGPAGGMLAAWNASGTPEAGQLDLYLGPAPQAVDVWGNRTDIPTSRGRHQHTIGRMPVFFEGIDPQLALFRAAFKLDQPFIKSLQRPHDRTVSLHNPWPRTISGYMLIVGPDKWQIEPRRSYFSIAAGQTRQIPLTLSFPVSETAGHKRLIARFTFTAEREYEVRVRAPMELGLEEMQLDASAALAAGADGQADLIVTGLVTNRSDDRLAMYAFASLPGHAR